MDFPLHSTTAEREGYPQKAIKHQWFAVIERYAGAVIDPTKVKEARYLCMDLLLALSWCMRQVPQPAGERILIYEDGAEWCACFEGHESLPEDLLGFGVTADEALGQLMEQWQEERT